AQAREQAIDLAQALDLAMRDGHALAKAGRAQLLTLGQAGKNRGRIHFQPLGGEVRELLQQRSLVAAWKSGLDCVEIEEVGKLHGGDSQNRGNVTLPLGQRWYQAMCGSTQPMFPSSRR